MASTALEMSIVNFREGLYCAFSSRMMVSRRTPTCAASCSCVKSFSCRYFFNLHSNSAIFIPRPPPSGRRGHSGKADTLGEKSKKAEKQEKHKGENSAHGGVGPETRKAQKSQQPQEPQLGIDFTGHVCLCDVLLAFHIPCQQENEKYLSLSIPGASE